MTDSPPPEPSAPMECRELFLACCQRGDFYAARQQLRALLAQQHGGATVRFVARQLGKYRDNFASLPTINVALMASYSIEFIQDALLVNGFLNGIACRIYQPGFNQFRQEILVPESGLYQFHTDVMILSVLGQSLCPALYQGGVEASVLADVADEVGQLVACYRRRSNAAVLVQNLSPPVYPVTGIRDATLGQGQGYQFHQLNHLLAERLEAIESVYMIDYAALVARHGARTWHDPRMMYYAQLPLDKNSVMPLAREFAKFLRVLNGGAKKCLVVDLDNTLWGGILGEDGVEGIKLGSHYPGNAFMAFQQALLGLYQRGVILAIASKNNLADVKQAFEHHRQMVLKLEHFSVLEVHWQAKSLSLGRIAKRLNIALEHMVFIDDNPVECQQVAMAYPMLEVLQFPRQPERFESLLFDEGLFDQLSYSDEDQQRARLYRQRAEAEDLRESLTHIEDFYRTLAMEISFAGVDTASLARAAQLTQKTNQFNATTIRYTDADLQARVKDPSWQVISVRVKDKFGDNGMVGLMVLEVSPAAIAIDTFLLSCRVIGRTVETAMLARVGDIARRSAITQITGRIVPTAKNGPVRDLYLQHGFEQLAPDTWRLSVASDSLPYPEWFRISARRDNYKEQ